MVIFRAQEEADGNYRPATEDKETHSELIQNARAFLTTDGQDLRIVAHLAEIDYKEFYWAMQRRYANDEVVG